jgi:hypothetical protein
VVDGQAQLVVRDALRQALRACETDVSAALTKLGWPDVLYADEAFFYTALFEEHGYLGACTNALDFVAAATLGLDGRGPFVWPLDPGATAVDMGGSGMVLMEGAVLRSRLHAAANLLCPVSGRLTSLAVSSFAEQQLSQESETVSPWVRARVWGYPIGDIAPWQEVRRLARLAIASEFIGAARRIIDGAVPRMSTTHQPGLGCGTERARSIFVGAVAEVASAKELIATSWANGALAAAGGAVMAAVSACEAVSQRAGGLCDGLDPVVHHPFGRRSSSANCGYGARTLLHDLSGRRSASC